MTYVALYAFRIPAANASASWQFSARPPSSSGDTAAPTT